MAHSLSKALDIRITTFRSQGHITYCNCVMIIFSVFIVRDHFRQHDISKQGFCDALRYFNNLPAVEMPDGSLEDRRFFMGASSSAPTFAASKHVPMALSNIAALLAQCMWESGGDAPFTACDENNYRNTPTAACTQRGDGARYDALNDREWSCIVDPEMMCTAVTWAPWARMGPLMCAPNTVTAGCCWCAHFC